MRILITGGAGFIGSALVRHLITDTEHEVLVFDKLTYAGSLSNLAGLEGRPRFSFSKADICDRAAVRANLEGFQPDILVHLAAESHVDRSIDGPDTFINTNILGTFCLLEEALRYWRGRPSQKAEAFRFHHVSTDEVYGSLGPEGLFSEQSPYDPRSPYSASKAASDHLVSAWGHTYHLPILISNCSNNYGPYHFPEKLIPLVIIKALAGEPLPIYGAGDQIRDWLYVDDHARALRMIFEKGTPGRSYNIGASEEKTNLEVVKAVCDKLDRLSPRREGSYADLITFVADRPGHDKRYAIDAARLKTELGWTPDEDFESGLEKTILWYLENRAWWQAILEGGYHPDRQGLVPADADLATGTKIPA